MPRPDFIKNILVRSPAGDVQVRRVPETPTKAISLTGKPHARDNNDKKHQRRYPFHVLTLYFSILVEQPRQAVRTAVR
jgi:hypothetical protein